MVTIGQPTRKVADTLSTTRKRMPTEPLGSTPGAVKQHCDTVFPMCGGVAMLRRKDVHDRDRLR